MEELPAPASKALEEAFSLKDSVTKAEARDLGTVLGITPGQVSRHAARLGHQVEGDSGQEPCWALSRNEVQRRFGGPRMLHQGFNWRLTDLSSIIACYRNIAVRSKDLPLLG